MIAVSLGREIIALGALGVMAQASLAAPMTVHMNLAGDLSIILESNKNNYEEFDF